MMRNICKELIKRSINPPSNWIKSSAFSNQELTTKYDFSHAKGREFNRVTLSGTVVTDVKEQQNLTVFGLETQHHYPKTEDREAYTKKHWHRIVVTKPAIQLIVRNGVKKGDRVYVIGKIAYTPFATQNGKLRQKASTIVSEVFLCNDNYASSDPVHSTSSPLPSDEK